MSDSLEYKNINPQLLRQLANGESGFITEMIDIFLEDVPVSTQKMAEALEESDLKMVARQAHKLKSSTRLVGADIATDLIVEIEIIAEKNDPDRLLNSVVKTLKNALENCYVELTKYRFQINK
jgi:HPt (histidine-containing phosphotransfer) domain-containing protein